MRRVLILFVLPLCSSNPECWEPIHTAAEEGDVEAISDILSRDRFVADAEDKCDSKIRPLMLAANAGSFEAVEALLSFGASPSVQHGGNGVTPLIAAAVAGHTKMVQALLERNAQVDQAESRNWTALCFAAQQGHSEVVDLLIAAGANVGWVTGAGLQPWILATDAQRDADADTSGERDAASYDSVVPALVAAGAPNGEDAALHLVGKLPLKGLAKVGVPDTSRMQRLLGSYHFVKVVAGIDPQQLAAHTSIEALKSGGAGADGSIEVAKHAVGGGPMPVYAGQRNDDPAGGTGDGGRAPPLPEQRETLFLKFDPTPGSFVWQLVGAAPEAQGQAQLYLRGTPPDMQSSNWLDPVNVKRWEVAVVPGGGGQTIWVKASKLRMVRAGGASPAAPRPMHDEL